MKRQLLAGLLLAAPLVAQEPPKPAPPPQVQKVIPLKYADPRAVQYLLGMFEANFQSNNDLHALAVRASAQTMQAIEEAIAKLDTPAAAAKDVDLMIYLIVGSDSESSMGTVPKDMEPVVAQLRNTFPFKSYRQLDVLTLRTRVGQRAGTDSSGGSMQFGNTSRTVRTNFRLNSSSVGGDGSTIHLDQIQANIKIPPGEVGNPEDLSLNTDLDIKEGQKVVVGRMGINREQALFLVLTAKLVQ